MSNPGLNANAHIKLLTQQQPTIGSTHTHTQSAAVKPEHFVMCVYIWSARRPTAGIFVWALLKEGSNRKTSHNPCDRAPKTSVCTTDAATTLPTDIVTAVRLIRSQMHNKLATQHRHARALALTSTSITACAGAASQVGPYNGSSSCPETGALKVPQFAKHAHTSSQHGTPTPSLGRSQHGCEALVPLCSTSRWLLAYQRMHPKPLVEQTPNHATKLPCHALRIHTRHHPHTR